MDSTSSEQVSVVGSCDDDNESSGSKKSGKFLDLAELPLPSQERICSMEFPLDNSE
jgi:hypothetical protein